MLIRVEEDSFTSLLFGSKNAEGEVWGDDCGVVCGDGEACGRGTGDGDGDDRWAGCFPSLSHLHNSCKSKYPLWSSSI